MLTIPQARRGRFVGSLLWIAVFLLGSAFAQEAERSSYSKLLDAHQSFGFKLYQAARDLHSMENVVVSPSPLFFTYSLLQNGADRETAEEIAHTLGITGIDLDELNQGNATLRKALNFSTPRGRGPKPRAGFGEKLTLANSLWCKSSSFRSEFLKINRQFYGETLERQPSSRDELDVRVNQWAKRVSEGNVQEVPDLTNFSFAVFSSAYYRGVWSSPFRIEDTREADFTLLSGVKKKVPMMTKSARMPYLKGKGFEAVGLHFLNTTIYLFVPDKDSNLSEFESQVTENNWNVWMRQLYSASGTLELPRFKVEQTTDMKPIIEQLGIRKAFHSATAFAPAVVSPAPLPGVKLTAAYQQSALSIDEKEAKIEVFGASAGVIGGIAGGVSPPPFHVIADRPFFFAVRDDRTGTIVFMGRIVNPEAITSDATRP